MTTALPTSSLHERVLAALDAEVAQTALPAWLPNICRRVGEHERVVSEILNDLARAGVVRWQRAGIWGMTDVARVPPAWQVPGSLDWRIVSAVESIGRKDGGVARLVFIGYRTALHDSELLRARLADLVADGVLVAVPGGWRMAREH